MPNCRQEVKERMNNGNDSRGARREFDKERRRRNQRSLEGKKFQEGFFKSLRLQIELVPHLQ